MYTLIHVWCIPLKYVWYILWYTFDLYLDRHWIYLTSLIFIRPMLWSIWHIGLDLWARLVQAGLRVLSAYLFVNALHGVGSGTWCAEMQPGLHLHVCGSHAETLVRLCREWEDMLRRIEIWCAGTLSVPQVCVCFASAEMLFRLRSEWGGTLC